MVLSWQTLLRIWLLLTESEEKKWVGRTRAADYAADQPESLQVIKTKQPLKLHSVYAAILFLSSGFHIIDVSFIFTFRILISKNKY